MIMKVKRRLEESEVTPYTNTKSEAWNGKADPMKSAIRYMTPMAEALVRTGTQAQEGL